MESAVSIRGWARVRLQHPDGTETVQTVGNLVTQYGDQFYGERAAGVGSHNAPSGMRLGTGTTAAAKTGDGAAIVTYLSTSSKALTGTPASALESGKRRITYSVTWAAGDATNSAISEAVITNESTVTNVAGTAANTISRIVFSPAINKGADDALLIDWFHDLLGA